MALFDDSFQDENAPPRNMSDSDDAFELSDDGSDYEVASDAKSKAKATTAATKRSKKTSPTPVPPAKKKKPLKSIENIVGNDADNNGDNDYDDEEPVVATKKATPKKKTTASSQYQKLSQLEHVLKRPDTYIGSVEFHENKIWVFDTNEERMVYRDVKIVPGLYKIFDEILVNAADNKIRDSSMTMLKVTIDREKNSISVMNNGRGIPIEMHDKEKMYIPELIFGNLLTSSNYDDDEKKVTGGRNGYGAKLCNIFSTKFIVETADKKRKYTQTWTGNMSKCGKPKIVDLKKPEEYTKITFEPDLEKFGMTELDDDIMGVLYRRVYDLAGSVSKIKVYLNGKILKITSFKQYVEMFVNALQEQSRPSSAEEGELPKPTIVHEKINDRWEIAFGVTDGNAFNQVSFVNSIATTSGGTHINYIADQLTTKISEIVKKKNKAAPIKPAQIRNNMFLFINCLIENPAFTSQTKEQLTTKVSSFGSKCQLSDDFMKKVLKTSIFENIMDVAAANADKELKKTDGGKKRRITAYSKLDDANKAGTAEGHKCTLILTEGDSAKPLAVAGLAVVGRDYYGVFPLRGKLLNVREATHDQIMKNAEIQAIKQIMGLQHKKHYDSVKGLRYGHIMIMTDQDHDGSHIKGLIINFLESSFPGLLDLPGFLVEFITPIVKVSIMRGKKVTKVIPFYNMPQYEKWREDEGKRCVWKHKYYKGLGSSNPESEGREYFRELDNHMKTFLHLQEGDRGLIELAFAKKNADARKDWLRNFKPGTHLDPTLNMIPISEFINKELILFSMADNIRSIPSALDGFKPAQRKIVYAAFKRNMVNEIKVSQFIGYASENSGYHHGEQSLYTTIVSLAQDYVGANNLYLMLPKGAFGSRAVGGKDASAARYISTQLNPLTRIVFNPNDDALLNYLQDDDSSIEPEWYLPILPMLLVNGSEGIGTGWSTSVPPYNPSDIVDNLKRLMNNQEPLAMAPWFRGWTGTLERLADDKFRLSGMIDKVDNNTLVISELPARTWTQSTKELLLEAIVKDKRDKNDKGFIDDFTEEHAAGIKFVVKLTNAQMAAAEAEGLMQKFKLQTTISTSNMIAFDPQGRIQRYATPEDILKEFYLVRLEYFQKRKDHMTDVLKNKLEKLSQQARFVKLIIEKKISISNKKKVDLMDMLAQNNFPKFGKNGIPIFPDQEDSDNEIADKTLEEINDLAEEDEEVAEVVRDQNVVKPEPANYDYLLGMSLWSLTREHYERLLKQRDNTESELVELLGKSAKDLWSAELDIFETQWAKFLEEDRERRENLTGAKPSKKGKGRKKKDYSDDDDDDDFGAKKKKKVTKKSVKTEVVPSVERRRVQLTLDYKRDSTLQPPELKLTKGKVKKEPPIKKEEADKPVSSTAEPESPKSPPQTKKTIFGGGVSTIFGSPSTSRKKDEFDMDPDDLYNDLMKGKSSGMSSAKKSKGASVFDDLSDGDPFASDNDDKPKAKPKPKAKAMSVVVESDDEGEIFKPKKAPVKRAPAKKAAKKVVESDDDDEAPVPVKKTVAKKAAPKKSAKKVAESEDEEDDDEPLRSKKKPSAKKAQKGIFDDSDADMAEDSGDEEVEVVTSRARSSRRAATEKKTYNISLDMSDDDEELADEQESEDEFDDEFDDE